MAKWLEGAMDLFFDKVPDDKTTEDAPPRGKGAHASTPRSAPAPTGSAPAPRAGGLASVANGEKAYEYLKGIIAEATESPAYDAFRTQLDALSSVLKDEGQLYAAAFPAADAMTDEQLSASHLTDAIDRELKALDEGIGEFREEAAARRANDLQDTEAQAKDLARQIAELEKQLADLMAQHQAAESRIGEREAYYASQQANFDAGAERLRTELTTERDAINRHFAQTK